MGLMDFINKLRKDKGFEAFPQSILSADLSQRDFDAIVNSYMARHSPHFANAEPQDFVFNPVDGDVLRMKLLGCIAGDEYVNLKTNEHIRIERDEIERLEYIPKKIAYINPTITDDANRARMYMHQYTYGDVIKDKMFTYEYTRKNFFIEPEIDPKILTSKYSLIDDFDESYEPYEYVKDGFSATCYEKEKPLKDVYVRSGIGGKDIIDISGCFKGCKNLINIKHLPEFEPIRKDGCLHNSGITVIPDSIKKYTRETAACPEKYFGILAGCYNINGLGENYVNTDLFRGDKIICDAVTSKKNLDIVQARCDALRTFIEGKESECKTVEAVSFVYNFEPIEITRVQMGKQWYVMNGEHIEEYNQYMKSRYNNPNNISGLTTSSFSRDNQLELAQKVYAEQLKILEKAKSDFEKAYEKFNEKKKEFKLECDRAQTENIQDSKNKKTECPSVEDEAR